MERMLRPREVAERLGINRQTVLNAIHNGELPHVRVGRQYRVPESALEPKRNDPPESPAAACRVERDDDDILVRAMREVQG